MAHKNRKKFLKLFFEVVDVIFRGLKAFPVAWTFFKGTQA
jgi:hypothetical protein